MQYDTSLLVFAIVATGGGITLPLKEAFFVKATEDGREHPDAVVFRDGLLEQATIDPDNKMAAH
jgi:hypothetical protein